METGALKPGAAAPGEKAAPGGSGRAFPKADGGKDPGEQQALAFYIERLNGASPLKKLNQGYAYVAGEDGKLPHRSKRGEGSERS